MSCKKHPKYKAIRKPRVDCEDCWKMYNDTEKIKCYLEGVAAKEAGRAVTSCKYAFDTADGRQWLEGFHGT